MVAVEILYASYIYGAVLEWIWVHSHALNANLSLLVHCVTRWHYVERRVRLGFDDPNFILFDDHEY